MSRSLCQESAGIYPQQRLNYVFFDTETTGVPKNYAAPPTDSNNWPRMVQIAWLVYYDKTLQDKRKYLIKPEGYAIPAAATAIHGITTERVTAEGHDLKTVLTSFAYWLRPGTITVGHNLAYDANIVAAEFHRKGYPNYFTGCRGICTMKRSTDFCRIPGPYGNKWPKLQELHNRLFGFSFESAHDALADISATEKCFRELVKIGVIKL